MGLALGAAYVLGGIATAAIMLPLAPPEKEGRKWRSNDYFYLSTLMPWWPVAAMAGTLVYGSVLLGRLVSRFVSLTWASPAHLAVKLGHLMRGAAWQRD